MQMLDLLEFEFRVAMRIASSKGFGLISLPDASIQGICDRVRESGFVVMPQEVAVCFRSFRANYWKTHSRPPRPKIEGALP